MTMNRENQPEFAHTTPGTVYRMRGWRMIRKECRKLMLYAGAK
jgi:hypothetical protein